MNWIILASIALATVSQVSAAPMPASGGTNAYDFVPKYDSQIKDSHESAALIATPTITSSNSSPTPQYIKKNKCQQKNTYDTQRQQYIQPKPQPVISEETKPIIENYTPETQFSRTDNYSETNNTTTTTTDNSYTSNSNSTSENSNSNYNNNKDNGYGYIINNNTYGKPIASSTDSAANPANPTGDYVIMPTETATTTATRASTSATYRMTSTAMSTTCTETPTATTTSSAAPTSTNYSQNIAYQKPINMIVMPTTTSAPATTTTSAPATTTTSAAIASSTENSPIAINTPASYVIGKLPSY